MGYFHIISIWEMLWDHVPLEMSPPPPLCTAEVAGGGWGLRGGDSTLVA